MNLGQVRDELRVNLKLAMSFGTALMFAISIVTLLLVWHDSMVFLGALIGTALGWATGLLLAPYVEEQKRFQRLSKGIAGFLGGYVAAKVDRVFDLLLDKNSGPPLMLNVHIIRSISIATACCWLPL